MNTNQEITNSEESLDLQTRFDEALCALGNAVAAVTAINQARDIDEATRNSAMSVAIDALDAAYDAFNLAVSRFRKEVSQNAQGAPGAGPEDTHDGKVLQ